MGSGSKNAREGTTVHAVSAVMRSPLHLHLKGTLVALIARAAWREEEGAWVCWPSLSTIAADASVSRSTAASAVAALRRHRLIEGHYDPEANASTVYRLDMVRLAELLPRAKGGRTLDLRKIEPREEG
jgi:hypothetical protein